MDTMATSGNNTIPQIAQPFVAKKCATVNASSPEGYSVTDRNLFPDLFKFTPGSILRYFTLKVAG
jgi:hypothetical protein